jgi:hypothetical protein
VPTIPIIAPHKVAQGEDTARVLPLAQLRFAPPSIRSANNSFSWPFGTEGFRRYGSATLGIHKYLGAGNVAVQVIHLDEAHIELNGTFPGLTSSTFMEQLLAVITADGSKDLFVPGVFSRIQRVFTESYDFSHAADERTHSIDYSIQFVRTTVGATVAASNTVKGQAISSNRTIPGSPRVTTAASVAQSDRVYVVSAGSQSLREIAAIVYGSQEDWTKIIDLNKGVLDNYNPDSDILAFQLPTMRLPAGTVIIY